MTAPRGRRRAAVFLDRDGTLIEDPGYLSDPAAVRLLPGIPEALIALKLAGRLCVIITNQSGIGRGYFTERDFAAVQHEVERQLRDHGIVLDGTYHCPHRAEDLCLCRKPGLLLHTQAAAELGIDLAESWCVGDRMSDLIPARSLGSHACLVLSGEGRRHQLEAEQQGFHVAEDLLDCVRKRILAGQSPRTA